MQFAYVIAALLVTVGATSRAQTSQPATPQHKEEITVTADRGLVGTEDLATSVAGLSAERLQQAPGLALDDALHQVAGFILFRRTSSWTANPTTEGVSLRGLGSTAASRSLVVSDQVPLNDPFGGWVHWDEVPALAIRSVTLVRGGSADLYGSAAIGGVVDVAPVRSFDLLMPQLIRGAPDDPRLHPPKVPLLLELRALGASEDTGSGDGLVAASTQRGAALGAVSVLSTAGYIPTAPAVRGLVDVPSNVSEQAGRVQLERFANCAGVSAFLRGNVLNEARQNGTPLQTNGTRLWRYQAGLDRAREHTSAALRLFGSRESYRQSFSAIAADRSSEKLTKLQRVPVDEVGLSALGSHGFAAALTGAAGFDIRDVRATDDETAVTNNVTGATVSTSARQRAVGGFADALWSVRAVTLAGSVRVDSFRTFAVQQTASNATALVPLPEIDELIASPHVGAVWRTPLHGLALTANAFRAFRGPTMNELYRTGQVGSQTTLANASLLAERATGFEAGADVAVRALTVRAAYFWTEVNRPISAVLLSQTATTQTLQRQNLGQIRSRGLMVESQTTAWRGFDASVNYQLAFATVTAFNTSSTAQANLTGNWIPQVPREAVTAIANYAAMRDGRQVATLHLIASYTGRQFDDAANKFVLHPYARVDVSAEHAFAHGLTVFAAAQNVLDRAIDAGRTPTLTLAAPRVVEAGLRYVFRD